MRESHAGVKGEMGRGKKKDFVSVECGGGIAYPIIFPPPLLYRVHFDTYGQA